MSKVPKYIWKEIETSKVKPNPRNVKIHPQAQIEAIAFQIQEVGFKNPIAIDEELVCWAGHASLEAAKLLKLKKVPYAMLRNWTIERKVAYMIRDNQINESEWNQQNLRLYVQETPKINFTQAKIDIEKLIPNIKIEAPQVHTSSEVEKDDILPIVEEPIVKRGDIFQLGPHRLMCGDCTNPDDVKALLEGVKINQVVTDPPYGVAYGEKNQYLQELDKSNRIETPIQNDQDVADYREFFASFLKLIPFTDYNTFYIFMSGLELHNLRMAIEDCKYKWGDYLIWLKNQSVFGRKDYFAKHEFILYGWKGKHKFYGDYGSTIIEYRRPQKNELHPTQKPVGLIERLLQDGSMEGHTIYDPFLGSGTTLIACEKRERICYGMERTRLFLFILHFVLAKS